jgi:hypothetical protein
MFYWFTRGSESVQYEAREVSPTRFELRITRPGVPERVEVFETAEALHQRQVALERELRAEGWTPQGWTI